MKTNFVYLQNDPVSNTAHHTQDGLNKLLKLSLDGVKCEYN